MSKSSDADPKNELDGIKTEAKEFEKDEENAARAANQYDPDPTENQSKEHSLNPLSPTDIQMLIAEGKRIFRGLYYYDSGTEGDLSFKAGDFLEIISEDGQWYLAKHLGNFQNGYVPSTYVSEEGSIQNEECYHGSMSRKEAVKALTKDGNQEGTFLIRDSEQFAGQFSLSMAIRDEKTGKLIAKHYRIRPMDNGGFYITAKYPFSTLQELVDKYAYNPYGLCHTLSSPCPKAMPVLQDLSHSTRDDWEIPRSSLQLQKQIGKGQFGEVYKALWNKTRCVAVKTLKPNTMTAEAFLGEAKVMKTLYHKNIVQLLAVCTKEEPIYIVTELLDKGSLLEYLREGDGSKPEITPEPILIDISANVAEGMAYIERRELIHRDLAARNILLSSDGTAKVADFGLAKECNEYDASQGAKFPIKWTAPEAGLKGKFTIKSDVWSFGILLVEVITRGRIPYPGMVAQEVLNQVELGMRHPKPSMCSDQLYELMLKCWSREPDDRPTFEYLADTLHNFPVAMEHSYE